MDSDFKTDSTKDFNTAINKNDSSWWRGQKDKFTYIVFDGRFCKIGQAKNVYKRLATLKTGNPSCILIAYSKKASETFLHEYFKDKRKGGEWFLLNESDVAKACELLEYPDTSYLLYAGEDIANYIITFGKYKGTPIIQMVSARQIDYMKWYVSDSNLTDKGEAYQAFKWQLSSLGVLPVSAEKPKTSYRYNRYLKR